MRRRNGRRREGMTLVEVMVVVILMAMIASAVGVAVMRAWENAKRDQARADVATIRSAVKMALLETSARGCPTMDELLSRGILDEDQSQTDPWGNAFAIECDGTRVRVVSRGKDGELGTDDDIDGRPAR